jgi:hypothetical protein
MTTALVPCALNRPATIQLDTLPATVQDAFERLWDQADHAAGQRDLTAYALLHANAAVLLGIRLPASGELARCTCPACYCAAVFDARDAATHLDGTVERVQCPDCTDAHRLTGEE